MANALDPGVPGPPVDLFDALVEALRLTCAFDLHFCDRRDRQLSRTAEHLDERVRELQAVWPDSFPEVTLDDPVLEGIRREFADDLQQVATEAGEIADRLTDREPRDRADDLSGSAIQCHQALVGLWHRLAFRSQQHVQMRVLGRQIPDPHLRYLLAEARSGLPAVLLDRVQVPRVLQRRPATLHGEVEPTSFLRALRRPGQEDLDPDAFHRLAEGIARTWKIDVGDRGHDSDMWGGLNRLAEREELKPAEAKHRLIEGALGEVLDDLDHRVEVRVGQQWRKRVTVPLRTTRAGDGSGRGTRQWANHAAPRATPTKVPFWIEELPFYRRWKWVANKAIRRAEQVLKMYSGPNEVSLSEPDDGEGASPTGQHDNADDAFSVDDTADIEARLRAEEALDAVPDAGFTDRQAEIWLRQADLPPTLRLKLADGLGIDVPDHRQTRQEVADDLDIAPGSVSSHRFRARQKLPEPLRAI